MTSLGIWSLLAVFSLGLAVAAGGWLPRGPRRR